MKFLILATIILSALPCFSQVKDKAVKDRSCRVIFLQRPNGAPEVAHIFDGEISHKVLLSTRNLSPVIKLPGGEVDLLLGMTIDPVLDPENFPTGAPTVKIPATFTNFYLVVVSDLKNKVFPVKMMLVNASDTNLKAGQTLWINFTDQAIGGNLGKEKLKLPAKSKLISEAPLRKSGYYLAEFFYQPNSKSKFLPVMRKSWWFDAKSKNIGFVVNTGAKLPKIFTLRDKPAPKPPKPKGDN